MATKTTTAIATQKTTATKVDNAPSAESPVVAYAYPAAAPATPAANVITVAPVPVSSSLPARNPPASNPSVKPVSAPENPANVVDDIIPGVVDVPVIVVVVVPSIVPVIDIHVDVVTVVPVRNDVNPNPFATIINDPPAPEIVPSILLALSTELSLGGGIPSIDVPIADEINASMSCG